MFLKSIQLRGFKSFADKTVLDFEPGITVVVGPNGSGKSNLVDALTWVLGTHSAKTLRGGSMSDVVFAGSAAKPALGRALVEITIDNTDGALPIEFSEVTVGRSMFASGEATYTINGVECRALDVAELLSDTGLGRDGHTIVGQGQLDAVLNARPEERRAFIEEAAGILKHRRRKERALRKLSQMESHVERLGDVLRELRRGLRPLERQAEAAAKHAELAAQLREIRLTRGLRVLDALTVRWAAEESTQAASDDRLAALDERLAAARAQERDIETGLGELTPAVRAAAEVHFRLSTLVERFRGLVERVEERRRGLVEAVEEPVVGHDPEELRAQARAELDVLEEVAQQADAARGALAAAEERRRAAEHTRRAHEQAAAAEARRRAEARERLLRWEGEVASLRSALAQAASEEGRLASQVSGLRARRAELEADVASVQADIQRVDATTVSLAEQLTAAEATVARRQAAADAATRAERELERRRASLEARADALRAASSEATEGASALVAAAAEGRLDGVLGPLADHVSVVDGAARAVAAALGTLGDALVVRSADAAATALGFVRDEGTGRVVLLAAMDGDEPAPPVDRELADFGARPLADALRAAPGILAALRRALAGVLLVDDLDAAVRLAHLRPAAVLVTADGEVVGPRGWAGGAATGTSAVLTRAAAEQAEAELEVVAADLLVAHRKVGDADRDLTAARRELDAATAAMQEADALITSAAERLGRLRKEAETCARELAVLEGQQADLAREMDERRGRLDVLEARGPELHADHHGQTEHGADLEAERLEDLLVQAREAEVEARLAVSRVEHEGAELRRRVDGLQAEADRVERQIVERERRRVARLAAIERCAELAALGTAALERSIISAEQAAAERDRVEEARAACQRELGVVRAALREAEAEHAELVADRHREDLARQELRLALDAARARIREEFGLDPDDALATLARPDAEADDDEDTRLAEAEEGLVRKIGLLGTVNPLALEEYTALQERHRFLTEQIEDLRASRRDLLEVVTAVDERIRDVFSAAFADVAAQFAQIFPRLFPGGEGSLVLTDPEDLLTAGVDVEVRLPGKRVRRLSLLSGGERSLTALAVLFAIFAARPSPFYVLDEVEAALDDVNLQRFLDVVRDFRGASQLILVTHQKRTMEVADVLYGVTMQGNGVSKVISQRLRSRQEQPAPA